VAEAHPFRAVRYAVERAGPLEDLVAPPFDVISPDEQKMYYARHRYNVIRLILGQTYPEDHSTDNRYTRAQRYLQEWTREGILTEDPEPALYLYRHRFLLPPEGAAERLGLVAAVRLQPLGQGVFGHERTLPGPKQDQLALTRAVRANLSPVFAIYEDPDHTLRQLFEEARRRLPDLRVDGVDAEHHALWAVRDAGWRARIGAMLARRSLYIADGHHRYESALTYQAEMRTAQPVAGSHAAFNFTMMLLAEADDPGLRILPTHRLVLRRPRPAGADWEKALRRRFPVRTVTQKEMEERLRQPDGESYTFGLCLGATDFALLELPAPLPSPHGGDSARALDVAVLHQEVLEPMLLEAGIDPDRREEGIGYLRDARQAIAQVSNGEAAVAFLLRPPPVAAVLAAARSGALMPEKSTYFFPKPLSGLLFHRLDSDGAAS